MDESKYPTTYLRGGPADGMPVVADGRDRYFYREYDPDRLSRLGTLKVYRRQYVDHVYLLQDDGQYHYDH